MWEAQQTACSAVSQTQCPFWSIFMTMDDFLANTSDVTQEIQVFFNQQIVPKKIYRTTNLYSDRSTLMYHIHGISLVICRVYITGDMQGISLVICMIYRW
jgi:hypothetical protein